MKTSTCACGASCTCKNCRCGPYAVFFDTLGNTTRFAIVDVLRHKPLTVSEIVSKTKTEQTLASHSLRRLEQCGFVTKQIQGKNRVYSLNKQSVEPLLKLIDEHVKQYCSMHTKPCSCDTKRVRK